MVNITEPEMSAYLHSVAGKKGVPLAGNFELTSRCNFACPMCYVHDNGCGDELSADDFIRITDDACDKGMLFLLLTGGEPLARDDFDRIYTHAHEKGLMVSVNTNGFFLDRYFGLLKKYPPIRINISLYAGDVGGYIKQCRTDAFIRVTDNIKRLKEMNISVKLNTVITRFNADELEKITALAKSIALPVQITPYCYPQIRLNGGFATNPARLSPEDAGRYSVKGDILLYGKDEFIRKAERSQLSVCNKDSDCSMSCRAGSSSFWITHDGKMRACAMMDSPSADVEKLGFSGAWEQIKVQTSKLRLPAECNECPDRVFCRACAAMCYCETGATDKRPEYVCRMIRSIRANTAEYLNNNGE